jgi:hypothetical protein
MLKALALSPIALFLPHFPTYSLLNQCCICFVCAQALEPKRSRGANGAATSFKSAQRCALVMDLGRIKLGADGVCTLILGWDGRMDLI